MFLIPFQKRLQGKNRSGVRGREPVNSNLRGGHRAKATAPDLARILKLKRRQFAAEYRWPGPRSERGKAMSSQATRIGSWQIREEWLLIAAAAGIPVFVVSFITYFTQILGGPPWPTQLVITVQASSRTSPFDSVFLAGNQSGFFSVNNLSVGCRIISMRGRHFSLTKESKESLMFPSRGPSPIVRPASANPFTCPLREYVQSAAGSVSADDPIEAQILLVAKYDSPWWYPFGSQVSALFSLNTRSSPPGWQ